MSDAAAEAGSFTGYWHPVLAVACPDCGARIGVTCVRPSDLRASDFHRARKTAADDAFIARHGEDAWIERLETGWRIHDAGHDRQRAAAAGSDDLPLFAHAR